jgi:IS30 family transposase
MDPMTLHRIRRLLANGWRLRNIAHELGLAPSTIGRALRRSSSVRR